MAGSLAKRVTVRFLLLGVAWGILMCALAAFGMVQLIFWRLDHCAKPGAACSLAIWMIDYWWLPFLTLLLGGAFILRRARDRSLAELSDLGS